MPEIELPDPEKLEEARKDTFSRRAALCAAIFAVMLAITALGGSNAAKEMMLAQQKATNYWSYYQAKVIREHLYQQERTRMDLELTERGPAMTAEGRQKAQAALKKAEEERDRFNAEKKDIEQLARKHEALSALSQAKDPYFDFAEVLLQISIVMASVALLASSRRMLVFAVVAAVVGGLLSLNGFLMLVEIPFL